jgi:peptidylprolyl isomerase
MNSKLAGVLGAVVLFAVIVVVVLVAQGGGDEGSGSSVSTDTETKPVIEVPEGEPPTELEINDIVEGEGPEAKAGDQVTVDYVGVSYSTGKEFDASWDSGQPFPLQLGAGMVIPGWDEGLVGMKAGGRRELIIPPDLAYGPAGQPPDIGPDETLIFVVDMREIQPGEAAAGAGAGGAGAGNIQIEP